MKRRFHDLPLGILISCVALSGVAETAIAQDRVLTEIRGQLQAWEESIVQFRVVWRTDWDPHSKASNEGGVGGIQRISHNDWARSARGEEYWHKLTLYDGKVHMRSLWTNDAQNRIYNASYDLGESVLERPNRLSIGPDSGGWRSVIRAPFLGLWINIREAWLASVVRDSPVRLGGTETWEGRELPVLILQVDEHWEYRLTLDPAAGYLPRVTQTTFVKDGQRTPGFRSEVTEFKEVLPGFFFPWSGRDPDPDNLSTWSVVELKLNEPLDPGMFTIEPAEGTHVNNVMTGQRGYHGDPPPAALTPIPDPSPSAADSPPAVAAVTRSHWTILLAVAGVASLIGAWFIQRRSGGAA